MGWRRKRNPHQQQAAGGREDDEIPQQSGEPVREDVDPAQKLDVLGLRDSLSHCQETKATDEKSHAKMYIYGHLTFI